MTVFLLSVHSISVRITALKKPLLPQCRFIFAKISEIPQRKKMIYVQLQLYNKKYINFFQIS